MFKKFLGIASCIVAFENSHASTPTLSCSVFGDEYFFRTSLTLVGECDSPSHVDQKKDKFSLEVPKGSVKTSQLKNIIEFYVMHPLAAKDFLQSLQSSKPLQRNHQMGSSELTSTIQTEQQAEILLDTMKTIIGGDTGIAAIFPQQEQDLEKIDDTKRKQFISLSPWILKVINPEIAAQLKAKILGLDQAFITLVNEKWGEKIYTSCAGELDTPLDIYEVPNDVFGGLNVESILSINSDLISDSRYKEFKKLISIINMATRYVNSDAAVHLVELKTQIRKTIATNFTPTAIRSQLADHSQSEIEKSITHYNLWIQLEKTLI